MNSTLPLSESLTQKCNQASINIITNKTQEDTIYPGWAFMELPPSSNGTFDPIAAVESASFWVFKWRSMADRIIQLRNSKRGQKSGMLFK